MKRDLDRVMWYVGEICTIFIAFWAVYELAFHCLGILYQFWREEFRKRRLVYRNMQKGRYIHKTLEAHRYAIEH